MELTIKQKKLTFFVDKYEIYFENDLIFTAKSELFTSLRKIKVFDKDNIEKLTLIKAFTLIQPDVAISFSGGAQLSLKGKSWIYGYFILRIPEGTIEVHQQVGLKLAIFFNNEQVATISKNTISFFGGDEYKVLANSDFSKELLVGICIAWDMIDFYKKQLMSINIGNIGPVKRKAEKNWNPIR